MTLQEKIGQFFSPAAFIHDTEENIQAMEKLIREQHIGGITFFHSRYSAAANFEKRAEKLLLSSTLEKLVEQIKRYQKAASTPLLISIDAEFGLAMRIEYTPAYPYAITLGALDGSKIELVEEVGRRMGEDLKSCGIHLNFAPVADINTNPNNPVIGYRSFGTDKEKVSKFALATFKGMRSVGIGACYKHFPGHGDTDVDSHLGLPVLNKSMEELMQEELYPFMEGIKGGVDMIMVGHLAVPALSGGSQLPASLSKKIITGLLKEELGYKGLLVTDALNMKSVSDMFPIPGQLEWEAFDAGNDILCFSEHVKEGIQTIAMKASQERIEESFEKIMAYKKSLGLFDSQTPIKPRFDWNGHEALNETLANSYITTILEKKESPFSIEDSFAKLSVFKSLKNPFFQTISQGNSFSIKTEEWLDRNFLNKYKNLLIALYVPSAKPLNNFGMDEQILEFIGQLVKSKNCQLYLFGNPLAIKKIPYLEDFQSVVLAYQDFESTQKVAGKYFLERFGK